MKTGRDIKLPTYHNVKNKIIIANINEPKTTQIELGGWVTVDPDMEQEEINKEIIRAKRRIQNRIRQLANETLLFQKESIVDIKTGQKPVGTKIKKYQFMLIQLVLFNKIITYDKQLTKTVIQPFIRDLIDMDINDERVFNWQNGNCRGNGQYEW